jgi:hypothetical protein
MRQCLVKLVTRDSVQKQENDVETGPGTRASTARMPISWSKIGQFGKSKGAV